MGLKNQKQVRNTYRWIRKFKNAANIPASKLADLDPLLQKISRDAAWAMVGKLQDQIKRYNLKPKPKRKKRIFVNYGINLSYRLQ